MVDSTRSPPSGRELAALGRAASPSPLLDDRNVTVTGSPREADGPAPRPPTPRAEPAREPDADKGSRIRTREILESIIQRGEGRPSPRSPPGVGAEGRAGG